MKKINEYPFNLNFRASAVMPSDLWSEVHDCGDGWFMLAKLNMKKNKIFFYDLY